MLKISRVRVYKIDKVPETHLESDAVETKRIETDVIDTLRSVREINESKKAQFERRLGWDDQCYISKLDGRTLHFSWVRTHGEMYVSYLKRNFVFDSKTECWIFDCRTHEDARGKSLYPITLSRIVREKLRAGMKSVYIDVISTNIPSIKGIEKAGFKLHKEHRTVFLMGRPLIKL